MDEVRTAESKTVIGNVKRYLEAPENADVTDWAKYHSRMKGIALIDKLTNEGTFNWVDPVFWGVTPTMEKKWANLEKLEEEAFIKIVTGSESVDYFDTFVSDWKSQGGDEIINEIEAELEK